METIRENTDASGTSGAHKLMRNELVAVTGSVQYVRLTNAQRKALQGKTATDPVSETFNRLWRR